MSGVASGGVSTSFPPIPSASIATSAVSEVVRVKEIPDDNSCLFHAVGFLLEAAEGNPSVLRELVAETILNDPFYDEAILGKKPFEYAKWLLKSDSWGGAIELDVLAKIFKIQICAIDISCVHPYFFGEEEAYLDRIILLYRGIHYDAVYVATKDSALEKRILSVKDLHYLNAALEVAQILHNRNQYTNLSSFCIKCENCGLRLIGEKEATFHAERSGHMNFTEIRQ